MPDPSPTIAPAAATRWRPVALVVLLAYWGALIIGTHIPRPPRVVFAFSASDKMLHWTAYAGLAFLCSWYVSLRRSLTWRDRLGMLAGLALFGALDEITQIPVGRDCDLLDWTADVIGISCGLAAFALISACWPRQSSGNAPKQT